MSTSSPPRRRTAKRNTPRRRNTSSRRPQRRSKFVEPKRANHTPLILVVGAVALAIVAFAMTRGSSTATQDPGIEENRPVTVTGDALPRFGEGTDDAVGMKAPELEGSTFEGAPLSIADDGRPKVVIFLAHWCPHCQVEVPMLMEHLPSSTLPGDVDLYSVSTGVDPGQPNYPPSAWLEREGWTIETLADDDRGSSASAFGLSSYPYFVFLDAKGRVVERFAGELTFEDFLAKVDAVAR